MKRLPYLFGFGPGIRIGVVAALAVRREQGLALRGLGAVDLAEHLFRPFGRREAIEQVLDLHQVEELRAGVEEALRGCLGAEVHRRVHAQGLAVVAGDRVLHDARPLRPRTLRRVPDERRLDRRGGEDQFSAMPVSVASMRVVMRLNASIRPGPNGTGVARVTVR